MIEKELFLNHWNEVRGNLKKTPKDCWTFSKWTPGRVDDQCSTFYRKLVEADEMKNDGYFVDSLNQKLKYLWKSGKSTLTPQKFSKKNQKLRTNGITSLETVQC
jgi:hypothetical protein